MPLVYSALHDIYSLLNINHLYYKYSIVFSGIADI